jgi:hypothetical protein
VASHEVLPNSLSSGAINSPRLSRFHFGSHLTDHPQPEIEFQTKTSIDPTDRQSWLRGLESPETEELYQNQPDFLYSSSKVELKLKLPTINEAIRDEEHSSPNIIIQTDKIRWASDRSVIKPGFDVERADSFRTPNSDSRLDTPILATPLNGENMDKFQF